MEITKNGKDLDESLYTWDEETKILSTDESGCTINCESGCIIDCGSGCTINCWSDCTINCESGCMINCKGEKTVMINRAYYEVIEMKKGGKIKTFDNKPHEKIDRIHRITIDDKEIELSEESFKNLKDQLIDNK